jgi:hypothetical protein
MRAVSSVSACPLRTSTVPIRFIAAQCSWKGAGGRGVSLMHQPSPTLRAWVHTATDQNREHGTNQRKGHDIYRGEEEATDIKDSQSPPKVVLSP